MIDEAELKPLQENILFVAKIFDKFCLDNNLDYFLLGGTALGALRHQGFIPWDDDFDVCMKFDDYEKFLRLWSENSDPRLYLQRENTNEWPLFFSKLRLNGSVYMEPEDYGRDMHNGIYIDIMCLNNTFNNKFLRYTQYLAAKTLSAGAVGRRGYLVDSRLKKLISKLCAVVVIGPIKNMLLFYVRVLNSPGHQTTLLSHFFGRAKFKNTSFYSSYLLPVRKVRFEGYLFKVMNQVEAYLAQRFGETYMDLPSPEVRAQYPSHCVEYVLSDNVDFEDIGG